MVRSSFLAFEGCGARACRPSSFRKEAASYAQFRGANRAHIEPFHAVENPVGRIRRLDIGDRVAQPLALRGEALAHVLLIEPANPREAARQFLRVAHPFAGTILLADELAVGFRHVREHGAVEQKPFDAGRAARMDDGVGRHHPIVGAPFVADVDVEGFAPLPPHVVIFHRVRAE